MAQNNLFVEFSNALHQEILQRKNEISGETDTLYIGGGTPSVLPLCVLERIMQSLENAGHGTPYEEFTIEVNPEDIVEKGPDYVEGLLKLGVSRVSMGIQSFNDEILRWMNRRHDAATAVKAYSILEDVGVSDISIDLIYGLPGLSEKLWEETLDKALTISRSGRLPTHISSYQLSIEPSSALASMLASGHFREASDEMCREHYHMLCSTLVSAGYRHYEISNFALPGHEARHNSAYWKHVPYVGFGPAAHSYLDDGGFGVRRWNVSDLEAYVSAAMRGEFEQVCEKEILTEEQYGLEHIMLALRTDEGIPESFLRSRGDGAAIDAELLSGNLVRTLSAGNVRIPEERFFISDSIISSVV